MGRLIRNVFLLSLMMAIFDLCSTGNENVDEYWSKGQKRTGSEQRANVKHVVNLSAPYMPT